MSTRKRITFLFACILALFLAACTAGQTLPGTGDQGTPGLPPAAVLDAQTWLSEQLVVPVEQVQILEMEQVVWMDSCLELGQLDESCLAEETPGWRVLFQVNDQTYEVRTDETATAVRLVPQE